MVRKHGWQLPAHTLQVAITVFCLLVVAFYAFFAPFLGGHIWEYALVATYSLVALLVFILYVRCTAINPADPVIMSKFNGANKFDIKHGLSVKDLPRKFDEFGSGLHSSPSTVSRSSTAALNSSKKGSVGDPGTVDALAQSATRNLVALEESFVPYLFMKIAASRKGLLSKAVKMLCSARCAMLRFKGHDMLAPFTVGWQTTDLHPLVIEKSEGSYVYDVNGKRYLDSLAGLWCTALGGNEPRLVAAATAQLNKLPFYHSFWNRTTKPSLDLAKELLETFTARKMAKVFFTNSGSEANDTQVKLVWYYNNALGRPNKKKIIARAKSYHGSTLISASLSG